MNSVMDGIDTSAAANARLASEAGISLLRKTLDAAKTESEQLVAALDAATAAAPDRPVGSLGHNLDLRL